VPLFGLDKSFLKQFLVQLAGPVVIITSWLKAVCVSVYVSVNQDGSYHNHCT